MTAIALSLIRDEVPAERATFYIFVVCTAHFQSGSSAGAPAELHGGGEAPDAVQTRALVRARAARRVPVPAEATSLLRPLPSQGNGRDPETPEWPEDEKLTQF